MSANKPTATVESTLLKGFLWVITGILLLIVFLLIVIYWPTAMVFKPFETATIIQVLAFLLMISLFLERSMEVFITAWRGPDLAELDRQAKLKKEQLDQLRASQEPADSSDLSKAQDELDKVEKKRITFKSNTQRIALRTGLLAGLFISAVGVRALHTFIDTAALDSLPAMQILAFNIVDICLTGGVIAGGSEGIHKLTQVFTNFMESSSQRIRDKEVSG